MNDLFEICSCSDRQSKAEFACSCGPIIVFPCNICVVPHLREPRPHSFISIEQARNMLQEGSEFNQRYAKNLHTYTLYKTQAQAYLVSLSSFMSQIEQLRYLIINSLNSECERKINYLREIEVSLKSQFERLSNSIATSDFIEIEKYEANSKGVLDEYPDVFALNKEETLSAISKMILTGSSQALQKYEIHPNIQELEKSIKSLKEENEDLIRRIKEYQASEDNSSLKIKELASKPNSIETEVEIPIEVFYGEKSIIRCNTSDTIQSVKKRIYYYQGIPPNQQRLFYKGHQLEDSYTLANYHIREGCSIRLKELRPRGPIQIFINIPSGRIITLDVQALDIIKQVKDKIHLKESIPTKLQSLIFQGKVLEDNRTIYECNVEKDSTIHLVLRSKLSYPIPIFAKTLQDELIEVNFSSGDTVSALKDQILYKKGIPIAQQRLFFQGDELQDTNLLTEYKIKCHDVIKLIIT